MNAKSTWLLAATLLTACSAHKPAISDRDRSAAISRLASSVAAKGGVPGIAIVVMRNGQVFNETTIGSASLANHRPVTGDTPFQLASTTKIFTSAAVLSLVAEGKVGLDGPIGRYLHDLPASWRPVTIRQLLSHTSGLPDITRTTGELDLVATDWDHALAVVGNKPFQFAPGRGWSYTQTNYAILQRLIEQVSGASFADFLQQRLFAPAGMRNTFFPNPQRVCAVNYQRGVDGKIDIRDLSFPPYVHAAGGLCSSANDLVAWSKALDSGKVLPRALEQAAWQPVKLSDGSMARISDRLSYALGWAVDTDAGHPWAGHSGGNSSAFRRYLKDNVTIIVLHNGASDPDAIASSVAESMFATSAGGDAQTELWDGAASGDEPEVLAALQHGADVNKLDTRSSRNGRYALNWAAFNNHPGLIPVLLAHGAHIDAANLTGFTALHHAAEAGSVDSARALLAAGANVSLRTQAGETAADVARRKGHDAILQLIDTNQAKRR
jgi:CubicO group peptidase (beta-lactamase class C family)